MTVAELIALLETVEDKTMRVIHEGFYDVEEFGGEYYAGFYFGEPTITLTR